MVKKSHKTKQPIRITQNFKIEMKKFKIIVTLFLIVFTAKNGFSQTNNKDVTITSSGSGKTLEDAKQAALRSATEQAFGAFISSKTEMFNDQVVADQMSSVSSGNIKSYEVLNESQLPDMRWGVTIKALVSVDKLTSFVESKGITIEIKGGMFALNIKQQALNESGEVKAISEMVGLLHEPMQISFDYEIKSSDPKSLDAENKNWEIPLVVTATTNKNMDFCANYCIKTLAALSLSAEEVTSYKNLNKSVYQVIIQYNGVKKTFYLRKKMSVDALKTLISQWEFYTRSFTVQSGLDETNGNNDPNIQIQVKYLLDSNGNYVIDRGRRESRLQIHDFNPSRIDGRAFDYNEPIAINFLSSEKRAAAFSWQDKRTLSQIEKITGYTVKPTGVSSQFKHGGIVIYESTFYSIDVGRVSVGKNAAKKGNEFITIDPGGIAEKAGLMLYDKIISINNIEVVDGNFSELINMSQDKFKLSEFKIDRKGKFFTVEIYPALYSIGGLVAAITDLGKLDWGSAKTACDELVLNGYSDWRLPTKEELNSVYVNLAKVGAGNFSEDFYWSSTGGNEAAWIQGFNYGSQHGGDSYVNKNTTHSVRAVRRFKSLERL